MMELLLSMMELLLFSNSAFLSFNLIYRCEKKSSFAVFR